MGRPLSRSAQIDRVRRLAEVTPSLPWPCWPNARVGRRIDASKPDELDVFAASHHRTQAVRPAVAVDPHPVQHLVEVRLGELPFVAGSRAVPEIGTVGGIVDLAGLICWVDRRRDHAPECAAHYRRSTVVREHTTRPSRGAHKPTLVRNTPDRTAQSLSRISALARLPHEPKQASRPSRPDLTAGRHRRDQCRQDCAGYKRQRGGERLQAHR